LSSTATNTVAARARPGTYARGVLAAGTGSPTELVHVAQWQPSTGTPYEVDVSKPVGNFRDADAGLRQGAIVTPGWRQNIGQSAEAPWLGGLDRLSQASHWPIFIRSRVARRRREVALMQAGESQLVRADIAAENG